MAPAKGEANLWGTPVLRAISLIGLLLSAYATYAEHQKELDINFVAWCDIGTWASCSKVRGRRRSGGVGAADPRRALTQRHARGGRSRGAARSADLRCAAELAGSGRRGDWRGGARGEREETRHRVWSRGAQVFASPQGKIFSYFGIIPKGSVLDQPNAFYGCLFYICIILTTTPILPLSLRKPLLLAGTTFGILLSAYLAYVLAFVLRDFCIICVSSYVFNTTAFVIALVNNLSSSSSKTKEG